MNGTKAQANSFVQENVPAFMARRSAGFGPSPCSRIAMECNDAVYSAMRESREQGP
jgi:hypothetical protein